MPEPIPGEWIDAALAADLEWMRISRSVVFVSPARDQVRMMLEAVVPLIAAQAVADAKLDAAALEMARRKLGRIAALARNAVESTPQGGTPGVNADLLLALIGNEEGGDRV